MGDPDVLARAEALIQSFRELARSYSRLVYCHLPLPQMDCTHTQCFGRQYPRLTNHFHFTACIGPAALHDGSLTASYHKLHYTYRWPWVHECVRERMLALCTREVRFHTEFSNLILNLQRHIDILINRLDGLPIDTRTQCVLLAHHDKHTMQCNSGETVLASLASPLRSHMSTTTATASPAGSK